MWGTHTLLKGLILSFLPHSHQFHLIPIFLFPQLIQYILLLEEVFHPTTLIFVSPSKSLRTLEIWSSVEQNKEEYAHSDYGVWGKHITSIFFGGGYCDEFSAIAALVDMGGHSNSVHVREHDTTNVSDGVLSH